MTTEQLASTDIASLVQRLNVLEAEAGIRRVMARYMWLCDQPLPEGGNIDDAERIARIVDLYTEDATWEGVGDFYTNQFGRSVGREQLIEHFKGFWTPVDGVSLILNAHYLTTEQIHVHEDGVTADGEWIHMQPWLFSDGRALLRSSRLSNGFRKVDGTWKISRYRTENVYVAPLPDNFTSSHASRSVLMGE